MKWRFLFVFFASMFIYSTAVNAETLQDQIDATPSGGTLQLYDKEYMETAIIKKPITIKGGEDTQFMGMSDEPIFTIENTSDVFVSNILFKNAQTAIAVNNSKNVKINEIKMFKLWSGVEIRKSNNVHVQKVTMKGIDGQYASKGAGISAYESTNIILKNNEISEVQDAYYLEKVTGSEAINNKASLSRYGLHYMYGKDLYAKNNELTDNVTGIMLMIAENGELENNLIQLHGDWNSSGFTLYNAENIHAHHNEFKANRIAVSSQGLKNSSLTNNMFLTNQTALEFTGSGEYNTVKQNNFAGNIVNMRSDGTESVIENNYYDDYEGYDLNNDGIGDTQYVGLQSFGQWIVRQPEYQYFIQSPSVVLLNQMDKQTNRTETNQLVDQKPLMEANLPTTKWSISIIYLLLGILVTGGSIYLWMRSVKI